MLTLMEAERAFQLDPPPKSESEGFAAFLHFYEPSLNERMRRFLGKRAFDAETLLEYKLACAAAMLERWERFDPRIGDGIRRRPQSKSAAAHRLCAGV